MIKAVLTLSLAVASVDAVTKRAVAQTLEFPSLKDQYENAKIDELTSIFQNDPYYAGKLVNIEIFARKIKVDRTGEPNTTPPGTPPPVGGAVGSITEVLDGLSAGAKGEVNVNVERKWNDNGVLVYEKWGIIVGGQYNIAKDKNPGEKDHKGTGEKKE